MTVLFLDVDGVLNNHEALKRNPPLDPLCVGVLNDLVEAFDARIVVSSTWRLFYSLDEIRSLLAAHGLVNPARVIDATPHGETAQGDRSVSQPRGLEIQAWLSAHQEVTRFVILDDEADMCHLTPHLVKTSMANGLTWRHKGRVLAVLDRAVDPRADVEKPDHGTIRR